MQTESVTMNERIVAEARRLVGKRFEHQGRIPEVGGIDCWGLCFLAASAAGADVEDFKEYSLPCEPATLLEVMERQTDPVPIESRQAGHLAVVWFSEPNMPQHLGILTSRDSMVQIQQGQRSSEIEIPPDLLRRFYAVRSFREKA